MSFEFRPAKRENVSLLIGIAGGTGSGKTMSALKLARGLAGDQPFCMIDTESGRAKAYGDYFQPWHHGDLGVPFSPDHYAEAIQAADAQGYPVIVVDSFSHEHAGDGGLLDWHETELARLAGDDWKKREAMTFSAWVKPKMAHKAMVSQLLQIHAHLILCFRAQEKIEIVKERGDDGKMRTVVRPKKTLTGVDGWVPIAEKTLPYELTASFLMTADAPGVPKPIKLNADHRPFFPAGQEVTEAAGVALRTWAAGGATSSPASPSVGDPEPGSSPAQTPPAPAPEPAEVIAELVGELNDLSALLGIDTTGAILKNQLEHLPEDPAKHITWLRSQVTKARAKAATLTEQGSEQQARFEIPESARAT